MRLPLIMIPAALLALVALPTCAQAPKKPAAPASAAKKSPTPATQTKAGSTLTTDDQKTIYALGLSIYRSLGQFDLSPAELELVKRGMSDAAANKPAVELTTWGPKIDPLAKARATRRATREKATSGTFLAKAAAEPGAMKLPSGLIYKDVTAGTGASPTAADTVKVNYRGTLIDGSEFDSSYKRNEPAQFPLGNVIRCWTEGVQKMKVGGKAHLICPAELAYGDQGRPGIPGGATLIFDIELLSIVPAK